MALTKHAAYTAAIASTLTTELNSLANATLSSASSEIDNSSNKDLFVDLTLTVAAQGSARSAGATVEIWMTMALDGTNHDDMVRNVAELVAVFPLDAATTARQSTRRDVPIPRGKIKFAAYNSTGQAFASSGNIVEYRAHSIETA